MAQFLSQMTYFIPLLKSTSEIEPAFVFVINKLLYQKE